MHIKNLFCVIGLTMVVSTTCYSSYTFFGETERHEGTQVLKVKDGTPMTSEVIEELLTTKDFETMASLPRRWRKTLTPEAQRDLVAELLAYVPSNRALQLSGLEKVVILPKVAGRPLESFPAGFWDDKVKVREDVLTEGGRATWAIQELLLISVPPRVGRTPPPFVVCLCQRVIRAMAMPESARLERLAPDDVMRLASWTDADPRLLSELARSQKVEVRLAVAKNQRTSLDTLKRVLVNDPNSEVKRASLDNCLRARTVLDDYYSE